MIPPRQQWAIQIDITNGCHLHCSNCTRLLDHAKPRFWMTPKEFRQVCESVARFPYDSEPCPQGRRKVVGIIGGEPLLHPDFPELVEIMRELIPEASKRGLWTSKNWKVDAHPKWGPHKHQVLRLLGPRPTGDVFTERYRCGYLNWNMHTEKQNSHHQPMLVAIKDVVADEKRRWELIRDCWVQREWSSTYTPKGFFFCEVAGAFDMVFKGEGGLPAEPGVWQGDLWFEEDENGIPRPQGPYAEQVKAWCERCGAAAPMPGRRDKENMDDVSESNMQALVQIESPRVKKGAVKVWDGEYIEQKHREGWDPKRYMKT